MVSLLLYTAILDALVKIHGDRNLNPAQAEEMRKQAANIEEIYKAIAMKIDRTFDPDD